MRISDGRSGSIIPEAERYGRPAVATADKPRGRPLDVLVAEDDPVCQLLISAIVRSLGHRVTCVANGLLAVEAARLRRFDCVLMDMQMPEMDGLAATRAIRASGGPSADAPIIAQTADSLPERRRFYNGAGLSGFLAKPLDRDTLAATLSSLADYDRPRFDEPWLAKAPPVAKIPIPLFDAVRLDELRGAIGRDRVDELLGMLALECDERPPRIRAMIRSGAMNKVRHEAHGFKGASSSMGALSLAQLAERLEKVANRNAANRLIGQIERGASRTRRAIETLVGGVHPKGRAA